MKNNLLQKDIPKNWKRVTLGEICDIKKGEQLNKLDMISNSQYPVLNGGINYSGYTENWNTESGTITISEGGNSCGYINFVNTKFWCGGHCYSLLNINDNFDKSFLYQILKAKQDKLMRLRVGSGLPNIQKKSLQEFILNIPTILEQKKISEILSKVDEEINKTDELVSKTEKLKTGLINELFTKGIDHKKFKKTKLGDIPEEWEVKKLGEIASITRGGSPRPIESYITEDEDGLNWLKIGDIETGAKYIYKTTQKIKKIGLYKTTMVNIDDFILSNSMSFGRPYIMKINACIHDGWLAFKDIKTDLIIKDYLYYLLSSKDIQDIFRSISAGSGVRNLKRESVSNVFIKLPSIKEQQKISEVLSLIDRKLEKQKELKEKLIKLKKGLMSDLLSGKVRVN